MPFTRTDNPAFSQYIDAHGVCGGDRRSMLKYYGKCVDVEVYKGSYPTMFLFKNDKRLIINNQNAKVDKDDPFYSESIFES